MPWTNAARSLGSLGAAASLPVGGGEEPFGGRGKGEESKHWDENMEGFMEFSGHLTVYSEDMLFLF